MVRAFVAIDLCDEVRAEIRELQEHLKKSSAKLSFVDPGSYTDFKIPREVDEPTIEKVVEALV